MNAVRYMLVLSLLLGSSVALAQGSNLVQSDRASAGGVPAEVLVVLAEEKAGSIDPELKKLTALRRPPFNSFRSMQILSKPKLKLIPGRDAVVSLPNGRRLKVALLQIMPDGRYKMKVSINRPDKFDYLPLLQVVASAGDPFFVAGQTYKGGTLVVGVTVEPKKTVRVP
ncbi:MAG: hypothetical protein OEM15_02015 [Myxococcales bacterium]|nr:hypothetical protein [Myxococcales bacterium]MDH3482611.1 hypothetical protein [Myxococcales bacterium]